MAVPDWPNTYGYNLFLYPWQDVAARALGPVHRAWPSPARRRRRAADDRVGRWLCWRSNRARGCVRWRIVAAVGGHRCRACSAACESCSIRSLIAKIHGCVGPAFFALTVAHGRSITSRRWRQTIAAPALAGAGGVSGWPWSSRGPGLRATGDRARSCGTCRLTLRPGSFRIAVLLPSVHGRRVAGACRAARGSHLGQFKRSRAGWRGRAWTLAVLMLVQVSLGGCDLGRSSTAGRPGAIGSAWTEGLSSSRRESCPQASVTTAHVAIGSLIVGYCALHRGAAVVAAVSSMQPKIRAGIAALGAQEVARMSTPRWSSRRRRRRRLAPRLRDYVELTKPRIALTGAGDGRRGGDGRQLGHRPIAWVLVHTLLGTTLVAASASASNQWLERDTDAPDATHRRAALAGGPVDGRRGRCGSARRLRRSAWPGLACAGQSAAPRPLGAAHLAAVRVRSTRRSSE